MRKTLFAGLTVLDENEPVTSDAGSFTGRDRDEIDRLLEIGVKTHRHNGSPGIANPIATMSAAVFSSGGTIGPDQTFTLAYTVEDLDGGETMIGPVVSFGTPAGLAAPTDAPVGEAVYEAGGDLATDTYYYAFSYIDGEGGETPIGPGVAVERQPGYAQAKIILSGMKDPTEEAGAAGWRLYRAVGGGNYGYLASGTAGIDSFTDDGSVNANCDIPPLEEGTNSTLAANSFEITLPSASAIVAEGQFINVYMTNSADFGADSLLEQFPVSSAGHKRLYRSIALLEGRPPDVNTSYGGAHKIDPDTELLDWHWKRPVASIEDLPGVGAGTEVGDVRLVEDQEQPYFFNEKEEWVEFGSDAVLKAEGMGVVLFGNDLTTARPTNFKQYTWIGEAEGKEPENMAEHDILIDTKP